jgi:hypothetical protein
MLRPSRPQLIRKMLGSIMIRNTVAPSLMTILIVSETRSQMSTYAGYDKQGQAGRAAQQGGRVALIQWSLLELIGAYWSLLELIQVWPPTLSSKLELSVGGQTEHGQVTIDQPGDAPPPGRHGDDDAPWLRVERCFRARGFPVEIGLGSGLRLRRRFGLVAVHRQGPVHRPGSWGLGPFKLKCRAQPERAVGKKKSGPRAQPEVPRASQPARSRRAHALARGGELARRSSGTRRDPK